jgi:hypothetical protein
MLTLVNVEKKVMVKTAPYCGRSLTKKEVEDLWLQIVECPSRLDVANIVKFPCNGVYTYFTNIRDAWFEDGKVILPYEKFAV